MSPYEAKAFEKIRTFFSINKMFMVLLLESKLASFYQLFRLGVYGNEMI